MRGVRPPGDEREIVGTSMSRTARVAALGALVLAVVLVCLIILGNGSSYSVRILFANAGGLVSGDSVLVGPAQVGSVRSVTLTPNGQAAVTIALGSGAAPLHEGTVARIEENGLAGIASHYVTLQPAVTSAPQIPDGGTIPQIDTHSEVSLDELFDTFDPATRNGLRGVIRGSADAIKGRSTEANATLAYLDPALAQNAAVTAELARSEPDFDRLLVSGAATMQTLARKSEQLTSLVSGLAETNTAIASQNTNLDATLRRLPDALTTSTATFGHLRSTLDVLTPVVDTAKPAVRELPELAGALDTFARTATPTTTQLVALIDEAGLTGLLRQAPALADLAHTSFPELVRSMNASQDQLDYLRYYTPDLVAALSSLGQASAYYDANGHYVRTQPWFGAFSINSSNELVEQAPADRYDGLDVVHGRCPGGAVQAILDGSAPRPVPGCSLTSTLPGG